MARSRSVGLGHIAGIAVRVDASWPIIAALVAWSFWRRFTSRGSFAAPAALTMAAVATGLFFASVLTHELAHGLEARRRGARVGAITLFLFGGVTATSRGLDRPGDQLAVVAIGPFTSLVLGASFGLVATAAEAAGLVAVATLAGHIGWTNLGLGAFNLLPGAPLDGGRLLTAAIWWATKNRGRAVRVAASAGRLVGGLLIAAGVVEAFLVPGAMVVGLWLVLIGWFLARAAAAERAYVELKDALADVRLAEIVDRDLPAIPATSSAQDAADGWFRVQAWHVLPVRGEAGTIGIVGAGDVAKVPSRRRHRTSVAEVMRPVEALPRADAEQHAAAAIDGLSDAQALVVTSHDDERVLGLVTAQRLATLAGRHLRLRTERS